MQYGRNSLMYRNKNTSMSRFVVPLNKNAGICNMKVVQRASMEMSFFSFYCDVMNANNKMLLKQST